MARSPRTKTTAAGKTAAAGKPRAGKPGAPKADTAGNGSIGSGAADPRAAIVASFLDLLAQKPFERISLGDVATQASIPLAELRRSFGSTFDIIAAFMRETDNKVLAAAGSDMDDQPARDRLFDVLMRRLDVLSPRKAAIRSLAGSARRSPMLAMGLNRLSVRSQQWMLAAARIDTAGLRGAVRAQGLALLLARVLQTFLHDDDPGLARTMAALDRELAKGERMLGLLEGAVRLAACGGRGRHRAEAAEQPVAA